MLGIRLDWDVESREGHAAVEEDAAVIALRRQRVRRARNLALAALLFAIIVAVWAQMRLRQVEQARREALDATVESELLALRLSDRRKFMLAQSDDEAWRNAQRLFFAQYQARYPLIEFPGEVLEVLYAGPDAQVTVQSLVDGEAQPIIWYYRYTSEGWRHVASPLPDWAQPSPTPMIANDPDLGFMLSYYPSDQAYAVRTAELIGAWWDQACALDPMDECPGTTPLRELHIIRRAQTSVHWADAGKFVLVVPAVAGMAPNKGTEIAIAQELASAWVDRWIGSGAAYNDLWLRVELALWLANKLEPEAEPSPLLEPFVQAFGDEAVIDVISEARAGRSGMDALRATMIRHAPQDEPPSAYFLTYLLRSETALRTQYPGISAEGVFYHAIPDTDTALAIAEQMGVLSGMDPPSVLVHNVKTFRGVVWAEVHYTSTAPGSEGSQRIALIPFAYEDGMWSHPYTMLSDWGESNTEAGDHIMLHYYQLDAPYTAGLLAWLDEAYAIVARDFGLSEDPPEVLFRVRTSVNPFNEPVDERGQLVTGIVSPYRACCLPSYTPQEYMRQAGALALIDAVVARYGAADVSLLNVREGFLDWEAEWLGLSYRQAMDAQLDAFLFIPDNPSLPPDSLLVTWETIEFTADPYGRRVRRVAVMALLDVVYEQYGPERVGLLLQNIDLSPDLDAWLSVGVLRGIAPQEIEAAWRERFHARLAESGLLP